MENKEQEKTLKERFEEIKNEYTENFVKIYFKDFTFLWVGDFLYVIKSKNAYSFYIRDVIFAVNNKVNQIDLINFYEYNSSLLANGLGEVSLHQYVTGKLTHPIDKIKKLQSLQIEKQRIQKNIDKLFAELKK